MKHSFQIIIFTLGFLLGQTPGQISQAKKMIKQVGMSENQVKDAAKKQGYSNDQIDNTLSNNQDTKNNSSNAIIDSENKETSLNIEKSNEVVQGESVTEDVNSKKNEELNVMGEDDLEIVDESELSFQSESQPDITKLAYFGYDIFARDPSLFQAASVGVVDPDYLIGPGDEIIVMLWGETQFRQVLTVDREGFVFVPEIGQVFVNGLNLNLLESKLFKVFSQSYASLNPQGRTPTTFLDVSLGNLRPLRIQVLGEVAQPGAYTVSPSATLFSALYYFNGPTTLGSLRDIQLIRGGKKIASIDFYDYLLTGKKPNDQMLQLDDVIYIPRRMKTVSIEGQINRGGIYELQPKESLSDFINIAGGLKITAYLDRAQIDRIVPFEDRADLGMDRMYTDVNLEEVLASEDSFQLQDGDRIQVFSVLDIRQNIVDIRGAVTRPGSYDLGDSLKLSELIKNADGLMGDAYLDRADVVRIKPDFTEELIKLNLGKVLAGDPNSDINLKGLDRVRVYGMTEMVPKTYVSISGHVKRPGRYLLQENMTLYDLLFKSGGYVDEDYKKLTYLNRAELVREQKDSDEKELISFNLNQVLDKQGMANILLRSDDAVRVYSVREIEGEVRYVSIMGHVKRPGRYELFEENMTIYDLLFKSGGFDDPLFKSKTFLDRADLIRYNNDRITQTIIPFDLGKILSNKEDKQNLILLAGDEIRVYSESIFNNVQPVSISGAVINPGPYQLKTNMTLRDLIVESGGLNKNVYRFKVEVARINPFNDNLDTYAEIIAFNVDENLSVLFTDYDKDSKKGYRPNTFKLKPHDLVYVRPDPYFNKQKQVNISGEVLYPGDYTILDSDEKITDIIERAGGFLKGAYPDASDYFRDGDKIYVAFKKIMKNPKSKLNFSVQDKDKIIINSHPSLVSIVGEARKVGTHKFIPGKRLRYYLRVSGGLSPDADKKNIWIEYPNGDSKQYSNWSLFSPKVIDGSIINIGKLKEEEPFDRTEYLKELTSIIANLAQTITVVSLALRSI